MKYKILLILLTLVVFVFGAGVTYSAFTTDTSLIIEDQKIAKFIFEAKETEKLELTPSLLPGDTEEYEFSVTNANEQESSNVTMNYQIILKTFHFMPLTLELYKKGTEEVIMSCDERYSRNDQGELLCNSEVLEMKHDAKNLDEYQLKVTFPAEYNGMEYEDLVDFIDIEIKSWQKTGK